MNPISTTPILPEILLNVFDYLTKEELTRAGLVCRQWRMVSEDNTLWKKFINEHKNDDNVTWKDFVVSRIVTERYQGLYALNQRLYVSNSLRFNVLSQTPPMFTDAAYTYPSGYDFKRITCFCPYTNFTKEEIPLGDIMIFTAHEDYLIRLWAINELDNRHFNVTCLATLQGHHGIVTELKMRTDHIFSAAEDQTVKIWRIYRNQNLRLKELKCIRNVRLPKGKVACLIPLTVDFDNFSFYIGVDNRIERYFIDSKEKISRDVIFTLLKGRVNRLCQLILKQNTIFCGSTSGEVFILQGDLQGKMHCIQVTRAHASPVTALASHTFKRQLISGSADGEICVWEKKKENEPWEIQSRFREQKYKITHIKFGPRLGFAMRQIFFTLSNDNSIVSWEYSQEKNVYERVSKIISPYSFFGTS
jgi:WD40 repeat protein